MCDNAGTVLSNRHCLLKKISLKTAKFAAHISTYIYLHFSPARILHMIFCVLSTLINNIKIIYECRNKIMLIKKKIAPTI